MYLLDTNVISEVRRRNADPSVRAWFAATADASLFLSVLVLGEVQRGIALVGDRDADLAAALQSWLDRLRADFADRLLPLDAEVALEWGRLSAIRTIPAIDGLLAATAKRHGLTLVTRNVDDVAGLGVSLLNPFAPS